MENDSWMWNNEEDDIWMHTLWPQESDKIEAELEYSTTRTDESADG